MHRTRRKPRTAGKLPSKPDIPPVQKRKNPGDDFYTFVNGDWLRHVNMPPFLSSYGVSEEIEEEINSELMTILQDTREKVQGTADKDIPHTTYLLGTLTESVLNVKTQDLNVKFVKNMLNGLKCIRDTNDLASTLGEFMKYRISTLLGFMVVPSEQQSSILRLAITYGSVSLPDTTYYLDGNTRVISAYGKLLKRLGEDFDFPNLENAIALETIAANMIQQSGSEMETLMKGSQLKAKYRHIPWDVLVQSALGWTSAKFRDHTILVFSKKWLSALNKWFHVLPLDQWKIWLAASLIMYVLPILPPPYDDLHFELFGRRLRGQSEKTPQKRLALRLAQQWLTGSLGHLFVKQFVSPDIKESASKIAREIRHVAMERMGSVDWMEPATRQKAQRKIASIYLGIAYPSYIERDKRTTLDPEQLVKNMLDLSYLDFKDEMENINTKLNPARWDDPVFAVNAYYYNEGNRLILPAGILRWPFFHPSASDGWNFGGLGAIFGHELTHAFDADGKDYDEHGNRKPWWSRSEAARYRKKTEALIELFNSTEYFGHHLSGALTLSENIADLGGVAISLAALKERLKSRHASAEETKKEIRDFFISFAISWRTKEKKEKAIQSLFMDVHSPPLARVNNVVSQFDDWYEVFDVKPGDELYKEPTSRIRIF
jgi:putative endopeptidase